MEDDNNKSWLRRAAVVADVKGKGPGFEDEDDEALVEVAMAATAAAASATRASSIADADSRFGRGGGLNDAPGGRGAFP